MTDRIAGLTVVLETDIREDDAQPLIDAIAQLRGVLRVDRRVSDTDLHVAETRVREEYRRKLFDLLGL